MLKKITLLSLFLIFAIFGYCEAFSLFQSRFEYFRNIEEDELDVYLDSIIQNNWTHPDSVQNYYNWLTDNKDDLLKTNNIFFKSFYYLESAKISELLNKNYQSHENIEEALKWLPLQLFPALHFKVLKIGRSISEKHRDLGTEIQYLKRMYESDYLSYTNEELSDLLIDIAACNWNLHNYEESMEYCSKVQPLLKIQDYKEGKIRVLLIMYNNSHFTSTDTTSTDYLVQALEIAKSINDSASMANIYENLGLSFYRNSNQQEAIKYYQLSRSYQKEKGSQSDIHTCLLLQLSYTLSDSIEAVGKLSEYLLKRAEKSGYTSAFSNIYRGRAWYLAKTGNRDSAAYYLDLAFENRQSLPEKKDASPGFYYYLYEVANIISDKERALKFLTLSHNQYVKLQRETNAERLSYNRAEMDYDLQKERIEKLVLENNLEREKSKKQKILISAVLLILILGGTFMGYAFRKYKQLKNSYRTVFRKNMELDKLYHRLSQTEEKLRQEKNSVFNGNGNGIKNEEKIYRRLKDLLETDKIYKQTDISLSKLARKLKTNTTYLSVIINSRYEESFTSLINKFRIDEARKLLATPYYSNFSIEGIAEEVGFHSRSAFYQSFKQITGLTPTQYLKNLKDSSVNRK